MGVSTSSNREGGIARLQEVANRLKECTYVGDRKVCVA